MTPFLRPLKLFIMRKTLIAVTAAGIGGSAFGFSFYKENQDLPLLGSLLPNVIAAQRIDSGYKPPSLRNQFNFVADVLEKVEKSVVNIELINILGVSQSNGSGFVATNNGLIITNAHVVSGKSGLSRGNKIIVTLPDGTKHRGVVADINYELDLAIIKCEFPAKYQALKLGRTADIRNGEFVIAMGSPLTLNNTNTFGIISNKQRSSETLGLNKTINYIQTDAAITFGNSGGPLLNLDGEVIGINSMKVTAGISFAIPIDYAIDFLDNFEKKGPSIDKSHKTRRKFIGVTMLTLSEKLLDQLRKDRPLPNDLKHGVLIWRVIYNSPAYMAGLHQEDIIIEVNGQPCLSASDMYSAVEKSNDEPVELSVIRHGMKFKLKVTPVQPDL